MKNEVAIELKCGTVIYLEAICQSKTYAELLEGRPTAKINEVYIGRALERAENQWNCAAALIKPVEMVFEPEHASSFRTQVRIPQITCMALYKSLAPARDKTLFYSELPIVWFQDDFAFPIEESIIKDISQLDWKKLAHDYDG
ncbi:MAG: hypothetical protein KUG78_04120 [Kangiellaceae bacterium]|nr:hypothetical protein [Kangiellaceae bacterium]